MSEERKIISPSIVSRDIVEVASVSGNIYRSIRIIGKRAKILQDAEKKELTEKISEFASPVDNLEEIFENKEQIEISKYYERRPKTVIQATEEFLDGNVFFVDEKKGEGDF